MLIFGSVVPTHNRDMIENISISFQSVIFVGECGIRQIFLRTDDSTNLTSPGFPAMYRDDLICHWTIIASDDNRCLVEFITFHMEREYDFLVVGNGRDLRNGRSIIAKLTGDIKIRTLTSSANEMWMKS